MPTTTIKVSTRLRERVRQHARLGHVSQAVVLERALDLLDRAEFFTRLSREVVERPEGVVDRVEREAWLAGAVGVGDDGVDG